MHFAWEISLGQVIVSVPLGWIVYMLIRISQMLIRFRVEHEILMSDWAKRQSPPVVLQELPTRHLNWL